MLLEENEGHDARKGWSEAGVNPLRGCKRSAVPEADDSYIKKKCMRVCARPNVLHVALHFLDI